MKTLLLVPVHISRVIAGNVPVTVPIALKIRLSPGSGLLVQIRGAFYLLWEEGDRFFLFGRRGITLLLRKGIGPHEGGNGAGVLGQGDGVL